MDFSPQPPPSEEPEQQLTLHSSEEIPTQLSPASDSLSEEIEQQAALSSEPDENEASEPDENEVSAQDENEVSAQDENEVSAQDENEASAQDENEASAQDENEASAQDENEVSAQDENEASAQDEDEVSAQDEDEAFEPTQAVSSPSQSSRSGVFIHKGILIAAASIVVVAVLLAALLVFVNRPKDPPADWIGSYTPPAGTGSTGKTLYYLHWTNQNGDLNGQLQLAANPNGTLQSLTAPTTGLYNRDNHIIYVIVTINGQASTLTGKINDNNDTLTLNLVGATDQGGPLVFHTGSADDYKQATKKLESGS